jgi:hypothetical protein
MYTAWDRVERGVWEELLGEVEFVALEGFYNNLRMIPKDSVGTTSQMDLGHILKVSRKPVKGFHDLLKLKPPLLLIFKGGVQSQWSP